MSLALTAAKVASMPAWSAQEGEGPDPMGVEGTIGLIGNWHPEYSGAARHSFGLVPAGFVSAGASRLVGTTVDSPLVQRPSARTMGSSLAWRF